MKAAIRNTVATGILAMAFAAGPSNAMLHAESLGTGLPSAGVSERVINVDPSTRWINVNYGETVKFVVNGAGEARSFVFRFDGNADQASLRDIAPQGVSGAVTPIYINQYGNLLRSATS